MSKDNTSEIKELKRQLKVEKALERVRTRTNKMHKSEELADVASLLFKQLDIFGADLWNCGFNIWDKGNTASTAWMSYDGDIQGHQHIRLMRQSRDTPLPSVRRSTYPFHNTYIAIHTYR